MNIFLRATKDATVYSTKSLREMNFGKSEILELKNSFSEKTGHDFSQILIKFDIPMTKEDLLKLHDVKFVLELKITESNDLNGLVELGAYPLTDNWNEGNGRGVDTDPIYEPVNWIYKSNNDKWSDVSFTGPTYYTQMRDCDGIIYDINSEFKFSNKTSDVNIDITNIAIRWILGDIPNNGLVIKLKDENVSTHNKVGSLKFYSKDTNTIYSPILRMSYLDYDFNDNKKITTKSTTENNLSGTLSGSLYSELSGSISGSLETEPGNVGFNKDAGWNIISADEFLSDSYDITKIITSTCYNQDVVVGEISDIPNLDEVSGQLYVKIKNIKKTYRRTEIVRFQLGVRNKNPVKTFSKKANYQTNNYTKQSLFFGLRDAETQEDIIYFDKYSKISCNEMGHYFDMNFSCCQPGRYYKFFILLKGEYGDEMYEDERTFSVET